MKIRPTRVLVWLIVAAAAAGFYFAFQPQPIEADFAEVTRGPLRVTLDEEGETRVRDRYMVSAPLLGKVLRIDLEPGDTVRANRTLVARFLPTSPDFLDQRALAEAEARVKTNEAAVKRARVDLDKAKAEHRHAVEELDRNQKLHRDGLLAENRLQVVRLRSETAEEAVRAAESAITVAEAELATSRTSLIRAGSASASTDSVIEIKAPVSGVVLQRLRESAAVVPAGEPLLEIADPEKLEIVSDMLSTDAVRIRPGFRVLIEQWGGDRALVGKVRRVEPFGFTKISALGVEEQRVNVIVDFEDVREAWEALGDGYRVEIRVVVWEESDVLKVPSSSLFRNGEDWAVYLVGDLGIVSVRNVEIGQRNAREAQVLSGLQSGDLLIAYPGDEIAEGVEVVSRGT